MRDLDTDALQLVAGSLGVGNPATAVRNVQFDDDVLQQVLNVGRLTARARSPIITDAVTGGRFQVTNTGSSMATQTFDLYRLTSFEPQWDPDLILRTCDIYLLGTRASLSTGAHSVFISGNISLTMAPMFPQGLAGFQMPIRVFSDASASAGSVLLTGQGGTLSDVQGLLPQPIRIPRGALISATMQSNADMVTDVELLVGVYPIGTGQDAVGAY